MRDVVERFEGSEVYAVGDAPEVAGLELTLGIVERGQDAAPSRLSASPARAPGSPFASSFISPCHVTIPPPPRSYNGRR